MRPIFHAFILSVVTLGLFAFATAAAAEHGDDPHSQNMHALGESFEFGSFLTPPGLAQSDLAFWGRLAYEGSYDGYRIVDISAPGNPKEIADVPCNGNQGDVIVWGNIVVRTVDRPQQLPNNDLDRACEGHQRTCCTTRTFWQSCVQQPDFWPSETHVRRESDDSTVSRT